MFVAIFKLGDKLIIYYIIYIYIYIYIYILSARTLELLFTLILLFSVHFGMDVEKSICIEWLCADYLHPKISMCIGSSMDGGLKERVHDIKAISVPISITISMPTQV